MLMPPFFGATMKVDDEAVLEYFRRVAVGVDGTGEDDEGTPTNEAPNPYPTIMSGIRWGSNPKASRIA